MRILIKNIILFLAFFLVVTSLKATAVDSLLDLTKKETNDSIRAQLFIELAYEYYYADQEFYDYAKQSYDIAVAINNNYLIAQSSFYIAIRMNFVGEYDSSVIFFKSAIKEFEKVQDTFFLASAWGELGNNYCFRAIYDECLDCFLKSLRYTETLDRPDLIAVTLNNIGNVYYFMENYEQAIDNFEKSYSIYREIRSMYGIALSSNNIGSVYLEYYNNYDSAYKYLKISEEYAIRDNRKDQLAETTANLAKLFSLKDNNFNKAVNYFNKSIRLYKELETPKGVAESYALFASLFYDHNNYLQALKYLDSAISAAGTIGALEIEAEAYRYRYKCDSALNNFKLAFEDFKKYKNIKDSILRDQTHENIAALQSEFDFESQEKENKLLIEQQKQKKIIIERQKKYNLILIIALVLFSIGLFMLFISLRQRKKMVDVLFSKNQQIIAQTNILDRYKVNTQSSINYARRIQKALMPTLTDIKEIYADAVQINLPKDIIGGDFILFKKFEKTSIVAVADSTGHGIPGALMSILNMSLLKEVMRENEQISAAQILDKVRDLLKTILSQDANKRTINDGMDIALVKYDDEKMIINYAGAYQHFFYLHNNKISRIKVDKQPVATYVREHPFTDNYLEVEKNDVIYLLSDGYCDQFSDNMSEKFGLIKFQNLIVENCSLNLKQQRNILIKELKEWQGNAVQTDDILLLALKI